MKIVADENIPFLKEYFGAHAEIITKPGRLISRQDLLDAQLLLVRSVTNVNEELLRDTPVKFVGSATTGFDHIDIEWLNKQKIYWSVAKGCNATAVVEYIICVIAALQKQNLLKKNFTAGVIGVGEIGSQVVTFLESLNIPVLKHDPIRAEKEKTFTSVPLNNLDVDFLTLHTPLTYSGNYPTYHLVQSSILQHLKKNSILVNTSRGSVVDFHDLRKYGTHLIWCLDVWENEPNLDKKILQKAFIATPHIAGYSLQSKYRGVAMLYKAAVHAGILPEENIQIPYPSRFITLTNEISWQEKALAIFNPMITTKLMKTELLNGTQTFDELRKNFTDRYEFEFVKKFKEGKIISAFDYENQWSSKEDDAYDDL